MKKIVVILLLISALTTQSAQAWTDAGYRYSQPHNDYFLPYNRFDSSYQRRHFYPQQHLRFNNGPYHRDLDNDNQRYHRGHLSRCFHKRFR